MVSSDNEVEHADVIICGAGIIGLVLALALQKHVGITAELYEKVSEFHDDVGAGMGMYPNGLRVIRDISPKLLETLRAHGYPYLFRRWEVRPFDQFFSVCCQPPVSAHPGRLDCYDVSCVYRCVMLCLFENQIASAH